MRAPLRGHSECPGPLVSVDTLSHRDPFPPRRQCLETVPCCHLTGCRRPRWSTPQTWSCSRASWCSTARRSGTCSTCASLWTPTPTSGCREEVRGTRPPPLATAGPESRGLTVTALVLSHRSSPGREPREGPGADPDPVHHLCEARLRGVLPAGTHLLLTRECLCPFSE